MADAGKLETASPGEGMGFVLREPLPWAEAVEVVQTAEQTGYTALFVPEIAAREAFSTLTGFSLVTSHIALGTGVVTMGARSPEITAMAAATLQDVSGGRHILGIGTGTSRPDGDRASRPLARLRAYVGIVRRILAGEAVEEEEVFGASGFSLGYSVEPPSIWISALGDRAVRLGGAIADGVLLNICTPERVARARGIVDQAAAAAGRDPSSVRLAVYVRATLGVQDHVALPALQRAFGQYAALPPYRRQFELMGMGQDAEAAARVSESDRFDRVPLALVRAVGVVGGRDEALARFAEYREAGADLVLCYPVPAREPFSSILGTLMAAAPSPSVES